ncbi:MAG: amino acid ABC transporter permease [Tyzzerella sp.]|nr:amino acid ABC transporter permease [Tyzzerella sp.]
MQDLGIRVLFMGNNFARLMEGLWITIRISLIAVALSIVFGILLGMLMTVKNPIIRALTKVYLEFIRIMPQLVLLFLVYFGLTKSFGINLSGEVSAVIVFTLWGTGEMGDLVRGALISIPKHQYESGEAIGLSKWQVYYHIIIPQILTRLVPLAINLTTRMIKTTSLVALIGVVEVLKVAQQIIEANRYTVPDSALWIYGTIFFLYFIACWPISLVAKRLEKRWKTA